MPSLHTIIGTGSKWNYPENMVVVAGTGNRASSETGFHIAFMDLDRVENGIKQLYVPS